MSGDIRIDTEFLGDLEARYRTVATSLREVKSVPARLHQAPTVESAFRDFQSRWDWMRGTFADAADGFADAVHRTGASFTEADHAVAATLEEGHR